MIAKVGDTCQTTYTVASIMAVGKGRLAAASFSVFVI